MQMTNVQPLKVNAVRIMLHKFPQYIAVMFALGNSSLTSYLGGIIFIRNSQDFSFAEATTLAEVHQHKELFEIARNDVQELFSAISYSGYVAITSVPSLDDVAQYLKGDILRFWNIVNEDQDFNEKLLEFFERADKFTGG